MSHIFKSKYPKVLGSSIDPYKLSLTIKGFLTAIIPLILVLAPMFKWSVTADDFDNLTKGIEAIIVAGTALFAAGQILWGVVRKILVAMNVIKPIE
jgi:hypothetical protein